MKSKKPKRNEFSKIVKYLNLTESQALNYFLKLKLPDHPEITYPESMAIE